MSSRRCPDRRRGDVRRRAGPGPRHRFPSTTLPGILSCSTCRTFEPEHGSETGLTQGSIPRQTPEVTVWPTTCPRWRSNWPSWVARNTDCFDAYQAGLVDLDQRRQRQERLRQQRAHVNGSIEVLSTERTTAPPTQARRERWRRHRRPRPERLLQTVTDTAGPLIVRWLPPQSVMSCTAAPLRIRLSTPRPARSLGRPGTPRN